MQILIILGFFIQNIQLNFFLQCRSHSNCLSLFYTSPEPDPQKGDSGKNKSLEQEETLSRFRLPTQ